MRGEKGETIHGGQLPAVWAVGLSQRRHDVERRSMSRDEFDFRITKKTPRARAPYRLDLHEIQQQLDLSPQEIQELAQPHEVCIMINADSGIRTHNHQILNPEWLGP